MTDRIEKMKKRLNEDTLKRPTELFKAYPTKVETPASDPAGIVVTYSQTTYDNADRAEADDKKDDDSDYGYISYEIGAATQRDVREEAARHLKKLVWPKIQELMCEIEYAYNGRVYGNNITRQEAEDMERALEPVKKMHELVKSIEKELIDYIAEASKVVKEKRKSASEAKEKNGK